MKKILAIILAMVTVLSCSVSVFALNGGKSVNEEVGLFYLYTNSISSTISISSKTATCRSAVVGQSGVTTKIVITQRLQKKSGESWKKIKTTTSRTYKKSSLSSGKTYYFRVKAVGAKGSTSSFSNAKKVTVKSASSPSNSSVVYITDTGKKYHRSGCSSLRKSKHSISLSNARAQGYTPCARCKP